MDPELSPTPKTRFSLSKNWQRYVFEFLLIFLAVFLGFLADNFREEYAERQHAVELAKSFYEELKNDSIAVQAKIEGRIKKEKAVVYMASFFRDSVLTTSSKSLSVNFLYAITARSPIIFTPRTVVLEQIKSSEALRYFKSEELRKLVGDLSVAIDYIAARQEYENAIFYSYMEPIMTAHHDYTFQNKLFENQNTIFERLAQYEASPEYIPFHLSQPEKINRQQMFNSLNYYHTNGLLSTRLIPFKGYVEANAALLRAFRKEYGLK